MAQAGNTGGNSSVHAAVAAAAKRSEQPAQLTGGAIVASLKAVERDTARFRRSH